MGVVFSLWLALATQGAFAADGLDDPPVPSVVSVAAALHEAQQLSEKKKWEEAAIEYRRILRVSPSNWIAAGGLIRALVFQGRREEALALLSDAYEKEKGSKKVFLAKRIRTLSRLFLSQQAFQHYRDGLNMFEAQKPRAALEKFRQAQHLEADNVEILTRLGQLSVEQGDFDTAVELFKQARRLNPFEPVVSLWLGRAIHQRGEVRESLSELKQAYVELGGSELAPIWYSEALFSVGNSSQGLQILEDHARARPLHLQVLLALARANFRIFSQGGDTKYLWNCRKQLQLILSRVSDYEKAQKMDIDEGDLGTPRSSVFTAEGLRSEVDKLLAQIEPQIDKK